MARGVKSVKLEHEPMIIDLYKAGKTIVQIANITNFSRECVRRTLRKNNITQFDRPRQRIITFQWGQIKEKLGSQEANCFIRKHSRKIFANSGRHYSCEYCGYEQHIQICHIKPVSAFSNNSYPKEINCIDNLIGLCPNCHLLLDLCEITIEEIKNAQLNDSIYPDW